MPANRHPLWGHWSPCGYVKRLRKFVLKCGRMPDLLELELDMKGLVLLVSAVVVGLQAPGIAQVDPKIAEFCLKAQDFQGCVNSMTGKAPEKQETKITVDMDKIRTTGNFCPSSYGYVGAGYCEKIICRVNYSGHDYRLGGKGWSCGRGYTMQFDGSPIRATTNEQCPMEEPELGRQTSCENGLTEEQLKQGYRKFQTKSQTLEKSFGFRYKQEQGAREVVLEYVQPECPAYKAGLRPGDAITEINRKTIPKFVDLTNEFVTEQASLGRPIPISYRRFDETRKATVITGQCTFPERRVTGRQNPQTGQWEELN